MNFKLLRFVTLIASPMFFPLLFACSGLFCLLQTHGLPAQEPSGRDPESQSEKIKFRLQIEPEKILVTDLPANILDEFTKYSESGQDIAELVSVVVGDERKPNQPSVLGKCQIIEGQIVFSPRFPFELDTPYSLQVLAPDSTNRVLVAESFELRRPVSDAVANISAVYPSASKLPENLLKFYIHFSQPMSRGDSYEHIQLLNEEGQLIELPFLELGEELWNREGTRFTLLFDPGRVKRGLKPREDEGAPLVAGKKYKLVIETSWLDTTGKPLEKRFTKSFSVVKADYQQPLPNDWKLTLPQSASQEPLVVKLPEPLDHALLEHAIAVLDSAGKELHGEIHIGDSEQTWQFVPKSAWSAGKYLLRVEHYLEDMAGNSVGRAFEVDLTKDPKKNANQPVILTFELN